LIYCKCPCKYCEESEYIKYENPDPSTAAHTPAIAQRIMIKIEEQIIQETKQAYGSIREKAILARDLRHSIIRELAYRLNKEVLKIDRFEQENSADLRNYKAGARNWQ
jgi:outer membrane lipopolysaccharide assembly protein LptE/RlpB